MSRQPLISVVMPVYNAGRHLIEALASVIEQSCVDWELICVNDGSRDQSPQLLDWFAQQDERIHVVHQANGGIVQALNRGCEIARAPLICRMDADDIALPNRFELQLAALRADPDCVAIGGAILEIDTDSDPLGRCALPGEHEEIVGRLLTRRTGLFHPAVMMRTDAVQAIGGYRQEYQWVEDHDLWLRLSQRGRLRNLSEVVLAYRQHASSVCWQRCKQQRELMNALMQETYRVRGLAIPEHLMLDDSAVRSSASPGKWARAAAKGGYSLSVLKHLRRLRTEKGLADPYFLRMSLECSLRTLVGLPRRMLTRPPIQIPKFEHWQQRAALVFDSAMAQPLAA